MKGLTFSALENQSLLFCQ